MTFSQRDSRWANTTLGTGPSTVTIGTGGCYLTSYAQVLQSFGYNVTPASLNQVLINAGRYLQGNLLSDHALDGLYDDVRTFQVWHFENAPADLGEIVDADPTTRFIIEVDFNHNPGDGVQTHFVTEVRWEVRWDGQTLVINDPWTGETVPFASRYGDYKTTIQKVVGLVKDSAAPAPQPKPAPTVDPIAAPPVLPPVAVPSPAPTPSQTTNTLPKENPPTPSQSADNNVTSHDTQVVPNKEPGNLFDDADFGEELSWFGTTNGKAVLQLVGLALGWLVAHMGLPVNDVFSSLLGLVTGGLISDRKNTALPDSTKE